MTPVRDPEIQPDPVTISVERHMPVPIHRAWDYPTHPTVRGRWHGTGPMDVKAGGTYEITVRHDELTPHAEIAPERFDTGGRASTLRCDVLDCKLPFALELGWP